MRHDTPDLSATAIPTDPGRNKAQSVTFLRLTLTLTAAGCAGFLMVLPFLVPAGHSIRAIGAALLLATCGVSALALWRGRVDWSLWILCCGAWLVVTVMSVLAEGLRSPIVFAYPAIIMLAGWLLGRRMAIILGLLTVIAGFGIALATALNILQPIPPAPPLVVWLVQTIVVAVAVTVVLLVIEERDGQIGSLQRMAQEMREQHAFNETLMGAQSNAGLGMFVVAMGKITYVNEAACRIFGYAPEEIKSLPSYLDVIHPDEHKRISRLPPAPHQRQAVREQLQDGHHHQEGSAAGDRDDSRLPGDGQDAARAGRHPGRHGAGAGGGRLEPDRGKVRQGVPGQPDPDLARPL